MALYLHSPICLHDVYLYLYLFFLSESLKLRLKLIHNDRSVYIFVYFNRQNFWLS
jgi:hypothetical protein